jgi:hypothetical protein
LIWEILAFIEQIYYQTNLLPTKEKIQEEFEIDSRTLARITRTTEFKNAYEARGLPNYSQFLKQAETKLLTAKQLMIANIVLNTYDRKSLAAKLKAINITTTQFQALQKNPTFMAYLRQESINRLSNADVDARLSLTRLVQDADLNAIKFFYEITGQHSPVQQQSIDLLSVMAQMMEILVQYLMPSQLLEVADKLESVLNGGKPRPIETTVTLDEAPVDPLMDFAAPLQSSKAIVNILGEEDKNAIPSAERSSGPERNSDPEREGFHYSLR